MTSPVAAKANARPASEPADGCVWAAHGRQWICPTHRQLGQRVGLGKLYRVVTTEGTQLVRAPDPATAQAAVNESSVQRAAPHEGDDAPVVDTRALVHTERKVRIPGKRAGRPWAEPKPVQFESPGDSPTLDLVTSRVHAGDDSAAQTSWARRCRTRCFSAASRTAAPGRTSIASRSVPDVASRRTSSTNRARQRAPSVTPAAVSGQPMVVGAGWRFSRGRALPHRTA
jgi:hypothetical protein